MNSLQYFKNIFEIDLPADCSNVFYEIMQCIMYHVSRSCNKTITKHHPVIQFFHYYDSQVTQ